MSKTTAALEAAVSTVIANTPAGDTRQTARQRAEADRAFAQILKLIAPRIRHFIRQYGLVAHWDDAEQCCAIGVHRAIQGYEPEKAQFTTFVNWQLRGELQSLRFRLMTDQRPSAKKVAATTVSLNAFSAGADGEESSLETMIEDEDALMRTESGASDYFTMGARSALIDGYVQHLREVGVSQLKRRARAKRSEVQVVDPNLPRFRGKNVAVSADELADLENRIAEQRTVVERRLFDEATLDEVNHDTGVTKERVRQITKSAAKIMAELAGSDPRFTVMEATSRPAVKPARARKPAAPSILPGTNVANAQLTRVVAIDPQSVCTAIDDDFDLEVVSEAAPELLADTLRRKVLAN
ncbi:sigma factor-like helix-turn-helix DNA-binding protein [Sphingomonas sp. ac-8]|uniref:sigma factor-like helix-turn-helix DNA-binding protein n=1 Tax=Sphingomonas sp. ac-8 TaxID=3242977 RepID=UPI003A7FCC75